MLKDRKVGLLNFLNRFLNRLQRIELHKTLKSGNVKLGKNVIFRKSPLIQLHPKASLVIEDNVTINSDNYGYHVNMFGICKFMADRPDAKIHIGENTRFHGSAIHAYKSVEIGKNCLIAANCQIIDGNGHDASFDDVDNRIRTTGNVRPVVIEDAVWLGTGVVVLPGVRIGRGSIISANSVVHCDIPPMTIAGGNPIKIIRSIS